MRNAVTLFLITIITLLRVLFMYYSVRLGGVVMEEGGAIESVESVLVAGSWYAETTTHFSCRYLP